MCCMKTSLPTVTSRIHRARAGLVVVDIQERLLPAIYEKERVIANAVRLIKGAAVLNLPTLVTEQYRKGLGATAAEVAGAGSSFAPIEKLAFSSCGEPAFLEALAAKEISDVILCGIEAHVCISQTCLDLRDRGFRVFVVADAVSSRTLENYRAGLDRMRAAGATLVSTEMVLFELLDRAGTDEFKQILRLVK
jgi:nicotinamidase-related amidase